MSESQKLAGGSTNTVTTYKYDSSTNVTSTLVGGGAQTTYTYNADDEHCWSVAANVSSPSCGTVPTGATTYRYSTRGDLLGGLPEQRHLSGHLPLRFASIEGFDLRLIAALGL